jgi:hypothetical protein
VRSQIRIKGVLNGGWSTWFDSLQAISIEAGDALEQVAEGQVEVLGEGLEDLEQPAFHAVDTRRRYGSKPAGALPGGQR